MTPYRYIADMLPETPMTKSVGLVRLNGSTCTCKPPGRLWCWWYEVALGDRWRCAHGGRWVRWRDSGAMAAWRDEGMLGHAWELSNRHPMCDALASMGWHRAPISDYRSTFSPPATPPSGGADGEKR